MKLVDNWQRVLLRSHSMRAGILGLVSLFVPELLFRWLGYDPIAPQVWFWLGFILLVYGNVGRLIKQRKVSG